MITKIKGKVVAFGTVTESAVYMENGVITAISNEPLPFDKEYDVGENYVIPGLIDVHTHGALGFDYSEADVGGILQAIEFQVSCGATAIMPTITSSTFERTYKALENIELAMRDEEYGKCIIGAHLEGPYFRRNKAVRRIKR